MTASIPVYSEHVRANLSFDSQQQLFSELYETAFPAVARFVQQMGGDYDEASDVFQDAVIIFYEKYAQDELTVQTSFGAYLLGIAKHVWVRKFRNKSRLVSFDEFESSLDIPDQEAPSLSVRRLLQMLERSGQKCMELLRSFYYDRLPMNKIRENFGYGSERSATVQKFKCIEKIRNEVRTKKLTYEDFLD